MFKTYVSPGFVTTCFALLPLYLLIQYCCPKLEGAADDGIDTGNGGPLDIPFWFPISKTASYYLQSALLIIGFVYYMILISTTKGCTGGGMWVIAASSIVSKNVAYPFVSGERFPQPSPTADTRYRSNALSSSSRKVAGKSTLSSNGTARPLGSVSVSRAA